jgi:uridine kinase
MQNSVTVTISGPTGSGKSAIYYEIMVALQAIGVPVVHADPKEVARQKRSGETDSHGDIDLYKPTVTLIERNEPRPVRSSSDAE